MANLKKGAERIVVQRPELVQKDTLVCRFTASEGIKGTFRADAFVATYESADLSQTPESLLLIPLLANIAPVAWALGAELRVPIVDPVFFRALQTIKDSLKAMYPKLSWNGRVIPDVVDAPISYPTAKPALLFSGGVDSIASYLVHRDEDPLLVTALGRTAFQELTPEVKKQREACADFATRHKARILPVLTNLNRMFASKHLPLGAAWWSKVQHGLAFLGLCAPLSPIEGLHTVYLSATHTAGSKMPWGSHPAIDNHAAWGSTKGRHDCYHLSRQQKVNLVAEHIRTEDPGLVIQICRRSPKRSNCSQCGKCCRTMMGLIVAGVDPNRHGFHLDQHTLKRLREQLSNREFLTTANNRFMWTDIQRHLPERPEVEIEGLDDFFVWFREFQINV